MDNLKQLIIMMATMSPSGLREMRREVRSMAGDPTAKELVLNLVDLYLSVGEDQDARIEAAAVCLVKLDELEGDASSSSSFTPSYSSSPYTSSMSDDDSDDSSAGKWFGIMAASAGVLLAVTAFAGIWPFAG